MSLESPNIQNEMSESSSPTDFPVHGWWKIFYAVFLLIVPAFSFWAVEAIKPEWQSGDRDAYVPLLMLPEASIFFLFLIAYSIVCYFLILFAGDRFAKFFVVRLGIYTGVFLALQYTILLGVYLFVSTSSLAILLVWFLPLYFPWIYRSRLATWIARFIRPWMIAVILIAYAILVAFIRDQAFTPLFLVFLGLIASGPFWSFLMATQASIWLLKYHEANLTLPRGLGITAWIAAYVIAWRYDILKMYELYAQLPPVPPPDCYIATAAAQGHANFVGSKPVQLANGKSMQVNRQLQIFKCAELALLAVAPKIHKPLRKTYDVIGKPLAHNIQNPFLADIAYLSLKPVEWITGSLLSGIVPELDSISMYGDS
ncbi:MAG: hypothetical protein CNIPEHKO_03487 [Anaerolineales bacterium]|nr:hypothetical protein [Anaerolineales bacterium]